jgi:deoxyribodipyrimidine photo-lyase
MKEQISIFWFRRDLRWEDNAGLYHALRGGLPVLPIFIFDKNILDDLEDRDDARVTYIHDRIRTLGEQGSGIWVEYGEPEEVWKNLLNRFEIGAVYANRDYEPYAKDRDAAVGALLQAKGIPFHTYKDQVIFQYDEVLKDDGTPYTVFTPYSRKWKARLKEEGIPHFQAENLLDNLWKKAPRQPVISLEEMGFSRSSLDIPPLTVPQGLIRNYDKTRDFPAIQGTSRLGVHFRFGAVSIREKARKARELNETFLNELIWRDFYAMILAHFPHVVAGPFKKAYEAIEWRNNPAEFEAWREGRTGYPIVDAGMRELNATGYMHNRVRMITASFLTKHLLIDWRWGEAYFARKLLDFDLASNNGGWQWAAGCGTDAAPYFRVFNPQAQQEKFDPELKYVKKWVPEYGTSRYPQPIVDHKMARERCLATYKEALS